MAFGEGSCEDLQDILDEFFGDGGGFVMPYEAQPKKLGGGVVIVYYEDGNDNGPDKGDGLGVVVEGGFFDDYTNEGPVERGQIVRR